MAYATKYTLTWKDVDNVTWVAYFKEDGFGGSITTLTPEATPCTINWNSSDKYQPIVGTNADFQIKYEEANALYVEGNRALSVEIQRDAVAVWYGFVVPGQYFWAFNNPVNFVTITANDSLGELKNIKFEDGSGDPYYGQEEQAVVIANILLKTGLTLPIWEAVNIFDDNHGQGAAYSALNQTYIYQEQFWDEKTDERGNCYEVLENILKNYGASIRQYNSLWLITRINSFSLDTIYWRVFNFSGVYSSNTSSTSFVSIDANHYYLYTDQEITKQAGVSTCDVTQSPPYRENIFKNGSFDSFTFTGGVPDYWADGGSPTYSADAGALKMGSAESASIPTEYIEASMNIDFAESVSVSFDITPTYAGSPTYKTYVLQFYSVTDALYYTVGSGWQAGVGYWSQAAGATATAEHISITLPETTANKGFLRGFNLRCRIYEFYNENAPATNYFHLDNLRMEVSTEKPTTKIHTYTNTGDGNTLDSKDIIMGDTWRGDYFASEAVEDMYLITKYSSGANPTTDWSITGDPTASARLGMVLARQTVEGYRRSVDVFRGTIRSNAYDLGHLAFQDASFTDEYGYKKRYFPMGISYDARRAEYSGEWIECPLTYVDEEMEWASHDCGGDATITGNSIEVDDWTSTGGDFAYFDEYTAVAGETVAVVITLTNDGGSDGVAFTIDDNNQNIPWGTSYLRFRRATAGNITFELNATVDNNVNITCVIDVYSLTGV